MTSRTFKLDLRALYPKDKAASDPNGSEPRPDLEFVAEMLRCSFHASVAFYQRLGFLLIVLSRDEYARFELPDGEANFSIHLQGAVPANGPVLYLEVDDVDATVDRLLKAGLSFSSGPAGQSWLWKRRGSLTQPATSYAYLTRAPIAAIRRSGSIFPNDRMQCQSVRARLLAIGVSVPTPYRHLPAAAGV